MVPHSVLSHLHVLFHWILVTHREVNYIIIYSHQVSTLKHGAFKALAQVCTLSNRVEV